MEDLRMDQGAALNREANMEDDEYTERMNAELDGWELDRKLAEAHRRGALEAWEIVTDFLSNTDHEPLTATWWNNLRAIRARYEEKTEK